LKVSDCLGTWELNRIIEKVNKNVSGEDTVSLLAYLSGLTSASEDVAKKSLKYLKQFQGIFGGISGVIW
jgi:hypothetical protein